MFVTIRGMLGSGAPEIGKEVARLINGDYVDREIIQEIAMLVGLSSEQVAEKERVLPNLTRRIIDALTGSFDRTGSTESAFSRNWEQPLKDDMYLDALKSVIESLALEKTIVIQGRGSQFILRNNPSALHVLIIAPFRERIKRVMATAGVDEPNARQRIEEYDQGRRRFIRRFFKKDIENPEYYDIVLNTSHLGLDASARIIAAAAGEKKSW